MSKKKVFTYTSVLLGIYLTFKLCWLIFPRLFTTLDLQSQDGMLRLSYRLGIEQNISPDIVYIDLDDKSLLTLPFSPNDPELYANLISALQRAGASLQLVDMFFISSGPKSPLFNAIEKAGNVYLPTIFTHADSLKTDGSALPARAYWPKSLKSPAFPIGKPAMTTDNLHLQARGLGHINCWPDHDGVYRRIPLFYQDSEGLIPTLSLRAALDYLQVAPGKIRLERNHVLLPNAAFPDGRTMDIVIPYDKQGRSRIHFTGPWPRVFAHYSVATILEKSSSAEGIMELKDELENSLVIISDVTTGGRDFGPVPFSSYSPLSELHAQFLNNILTNTFAKETTQPFAVAQEAAVLLLLIFIALRFHGYRLMVAAIAAVAAVFLFDFILFSFFHLIFPLTVPVCLLVAGATTVLLMQFVSVQQEKKVMQARLSPYFAPVVMEKILASPEILTNVSKKELTILFSDIVAFTDWSSRNEPQHIHKTLSRYFQEMSGIIFRYEGTIDKFMGDGLLAFFGDPTPHADHARRAVMAALAMQKKARDLKKEWAFAGGMKIRIRVGIHTGEVIVGNMGSLEKMDYTVIGSHVNLAQRLESNCMPDRILISREVHQQLDSSFITSSGGTIRVKGFNSPIDTYYVDLTQY